MQEEEEEEAEEKTRNTFACSRRKEKSKFEEGEERGARSARARGAEGTKQPAGLVQREKEEMRTERRRGAKKDGERARVCGAAVTDERCAVQLQVHRAGRSTFAWRATRTESRVADEERR